MERNNGMQPQDIAILLRLLQRKGQSWRKKDLAEALFVSPTEVGHSLNHSQLAGFVDGEQKSDEAIFFGVFIPWVGLCTRLL